MRRLRTLWALPLLLAGGCGPAGPPAGGDTARTTADAITRPHAARLAREFLVRERATGGVFLDSVSVHEGSPAEWRVAFVRRARLVLPAELSVYVHRRTGAARLGGDE